MEVGKSKQSTLVEKISCITNHLGMKIMSLNTVKKLQVSEGSCSPTFIINFFQDPLHEFVDKGHQHLRWY